MARNFVKNNPYRGKTWDGKRWLEADGTPVDDRSWRRRNPGAFAAVIVVVGFLLLLGVAFGLASS